jgi:hypothetical protein
MLASPLQGICGIWLGSRSFLPSLSDLADFWHLKRLGLASRILWREPPRTTINRWTWQHAGNEAMCYDSDDSLPLPSGRENLMFYKLEIWVLSSRFLRGLVHRLRLHEVLAAEPLSPFFFSPCHFLPLPPMLSLIQRKSETHNYLLQSSWYALGARE